MRKIFKILSIVLSAMIMLFIYKETKSIALIPVDVMTNEQLYRVVSNIRYLTMIMCVFFVLNKKIVLCLVSVLIIFSNCSDIEKKIRYIEETSAKGSYNMYPGIYNRKEDNMDVVSEIGKIPLDVAFSLVMGGLSDIAIYSTVLLDTRRSSNRRKTVQGNKAGVTMHEVEEDDFVDYYEPYDDPNEVRPYIIDGELYFGDDAQYAKDVAGSFNDN